MSELNYTKERYPNPWYWVAIGIGSLLLDLIIN